MKPARFALAGFVILACLQIAVVAYMMADCAHFLKVGTPARFACAARYGRYGSNPGVSLDFYAAQTPYKGDIPQVEVFLKKQASKPEKKRESSVFFRDEEGFARYPVLFTEGENALWRISAYGEAALIDQNKGILAYVRLSRCDVKKGMLYFDFPFNYFQTRDTAQRRTVQALELNRKDEGNPESDYKGVLLVRFGENGRWQIEDLLLDGKTVSDPENLPPEMNKKQPWRE